MSNLATTPTTETAAREAPQTMRAVEASAFGLDALRLVERPVPRPACGEILVRVRAPQGDLQARPAAALRARLRRLRRGGRGRRGGDPVPHR